MGDLGERGWGEGKTGDSGMALLYWSDEAGAGATAAVALLCSSSFRTALACSMSSADACACGRDSELRKGLGVDWADVARCGCFLADPCEACWELSLLLLNDRPAVRG